MRTSDVATRDAPRYLPEKPFPPYSYVTGQFPHPLRDPKGHSYGAAPMPLEPFDAAHWRHCRAYLYAVDLFNYGYYWEAHEAWESLWHACGRHGMTADFIKALIKLAAAGVKAKEGRLEGVRRHATRAHELFQQVLSSLTPGNSRYMGLSVAELAGYAAGLARAKGAVVPADAAMTPEPILSMMLRLE